MAKPGGRARLESGPKRSIVPTGAPAVTPSVRPVNGGTFESFDVADGLSLVCAGIDENDIVVGSVDAQGGGSFGFIRTNIGILFASIGPVTVLRGADSFAFDVGGFNRDGSTGCTIPGTGECFPMLCNIEEGCFETFVDLPGVVSSLIFGTAGPSMRVGMYTDESGAVHGWRLIGVNTINIDPPDATLSFGTAMSGLATVGRWDDADGTHGFLRSSSGDFTKLDVPGAISTVAWGIKGGIIVGEFTDQDGFTHGFRRSQFDDYESIDFPGAVRTVIGGINVFGNISGTYTDADGANHCFIYRP